MIELSKKYEYFNIRKILIFSEWQSRKILDKEMRKNFSCRLYLNLKGSSWIKWHLAMQR